MIGPIDAVTAIHNAFRQGMAGIDAAALGAARGTPGLSATVARFRFFNEVLVWHAHGEELAIFPAVDDVAPLVAEAYEKDHRGLDAAFEALARIHRLTAEESGSREKTSALFPGKMWVATRHKVPSRKALVRCDLATASSVCQ